MRFRAPADIGAVDFKRLDVMDGEGLAEAWHEHINRLLTDEPYGAVLLSKNYFDPRDTPPSGPHARIPWNGFPRALDRFHQVLASPTAAKLAQAERTADALLDRLYWATIDSAGQSDVHFVGAHAKAAAPSARRLRLGGPAGPEITIKSRQQDEYVEWHADHDAAGRLTRLSFTSEPPEYWRILAKREPKAVTALYRELIDQDVPQQDLFFQDDVYIHTVDHRGHTSWLMLYEKGTYNQFNKWNTTHGAVHLTHGANTLGAEVNLAANAANLYRTDGEPPDPVFDLDPALTRIACAGYGTINRSSDPNIGEQVGLQVLGGNRVSLTDPIGLYMASVDLGSLQRRKADGSLVPVAAAEVFDPVRGQSGGEYPRILHFKLSGPADGSWTLADCQFERRPLERGGQIARKIAMVIYADTLAGEIDNTITPCDRAMYCRYPQAKGYFGRFPSTAGSCNQLDDLDWISQLPNTGAGAPLPAHLNLAAAAAGPLQPTEGAEAAKARRVIVSPAAPTRTST